MFSEAELERLRRFPREVSQEELVRFFTLTPADLGFIQAHRGTGNRLGLAVQLCTLPWLGYVPDDVFAAPAPAVARLAEQLNISPSELRGYGVREQTRTDHLRQIAAYLGWRPVGEIELKELDEFLLARAMEHDSPTLLFRLGCEQLRSSRLIRPGPDLLSRHVGTAREAAKAETYEWVKPLLTVQRRKELDQLLVVDPELGLTRLHWLNRGATRASPAAIKTELGKLEFLAGLGAHELKLSMLAAERRRFLAAIGRRSRAQALARREPERRYPVLLTVLEEAAVGVLDEVVQLYDQAVSAAESRAQQKLAERLAARARASEDRLALTDEMLVVVCDPAIPDEQVGARLRGGIGMERLWAAREANVRRLPRDHGHLELLKGSYSHLREFTPEVLQAIRFDGHAHARPLLEAIEILRELNATGGRKVSKEAPTAFVPIRWRGYLEQAIADGDAVSYRHYWELTVLLGLRDALRSGDVFVPGSRRYADPTSYLMTPEQWGSQRLEFCRLVEKSHDADQALAAVEDELHTTLDDLDGALASGAGAVRLDEQGGLVIPPLSAESIPEAAEALRIDLMEMLPRTQIASLLIEIDRRTHFSDHLTHAGGKVTRSPELLRNLYAVLIAQACNLGLTAMAEASGIPYDVLAWTADWYFREDTLRPASAAVVNHHHRLPMTHLWGTGTLSSSDGQRFPTRGKSITARALSRYFVEEGISSYTHVSDQHSTYGTKVIVVTDREAHYVLDEILGNLTDLPITEHATDTHGVTLVNFALFDLVGMQLSPRIRDLGKVTLYRTGTKAAFTSRYPKAGPLLTGKIDKALIARHWDDLLRLAASLKFGHVTASLIVGKLSASDRQNALAAALKEYGALRCTIFAARYLTDEAYRRRITRQLNKGENLHALRRDIHFAHEGHVRHRYLEQQTEQALCLTLVTNAIVTWMTEYLGLAVGKLRAEGREVDDQLLVHVSPAHHENVILYGSYPIEVERELAELEQTSYRSLREPAPREREATAVNGRFSMAG